MSEQHPIAEKDAAFRCDYAEAGQSRCPAWRCDCFIATHPGDPFGLHPEAFIVARDLPPVGGRT